MVFNIIYILSYIPSFFSFFFLNIKCMSETFVIKSQKFEMYEMLRNIMCSITEWV